MPIVHVHMIGGRPAGRKIELARRITAAVVDALDVQPAAVRVLIHETPGEQWFVAGEPKTAAPEGSSA